MYIAPVICAVLLLFAGGAAAQQGGKPIQKATITLGTATPGGGFPLYGNTFRQVMNACRSDAFDRAAQHQGLLRKHPAARIRPA